MTRVLLALPFLAQAVAVAATAAAIGREHRTDHLNPAWTPEGRVAAARLSRGSRAHDMATHSLPWRPELAAVAVHGGCRLGR